MSSKECVVARCEYWDSFTGWGKAQLVRYWTTRKGAEPGQAVKHIRLYRWERANGLPTLCGRRFDSLEAGLGWAKMQAICSPMRWRQVQCLYKHEARTVSTR